MLYAMIAHNKCIMFLATPRLNPIPIPRPLPSSSRRCVPQLSSRMAFAFSIYTFSPCGGESLARLCTTAFVYTTILVVNSKLIIKSSACNVLQIIWVYWWKTDGVIGVGVRNSVRCSCSIIVLYVASIDREKKVFSRLCKSPLLDIFTPMLTLGHCSFLPSCLEQDACVVFMPQDRPTKF